MDDGTINFIRNEVPNDYAKLACTLMIDMEKEWIKRFYIPVVMLYCIIYDMSYYVELIYNEHTKDIPTELEENLNLLYFYYLVKNNKDYSMIKEKLIEKYKKENKKSLVKEVKSLLLVNVIRKDIVKGLKKDKPDDVKRFHSVRFICDIILNCLRYKFLIDNLEIENNEKIDRILNWNLIKMKKYSTIENKELLM